MAKFTIRRAATRLTSRCVASFRTQFYLMRRDTRREAFATYCELGLCHVPELVVDQNFSTTCFFCQFWDFRIFVKIYPLPNFLCKMGAPSTLNHPREAFTFSHSSPSCIAYNHRFNRLRTRDWKRVNYWLSLCVTARVRPYVRA